MIKEKIKKSLSQNFIKDQNICEKIVNLITIKNNFIIEIGPGYGNLTDFILKKSPKKLILIEKDIKLYEYLLEKYKNVKNIYILNEDVMNYNFCNHKDYKIISNLPYNISSKIILKLLKLSNNISEIVVMIQKEVALKFDYKIKKPNKYKFITKISAEYSRCFDVSANVFIPKPKVKSTVVKFILKKSKINWKKLTEFNTLIFKNKRKKIYNNLKITNKNNLYNKRVEELSFNELLTIYNSF